MPLTPKPWILDPRIGARMNRLLHNDAISVQRSGNLADSEGDPAGTRTLVPSVTRGTLSAVSATEALTAAERDTVIDKSLAVELGSDVREGDWVTVNNVTYEVVDTENRRFYRRAVMRFVQ